MNESNCVISKNCPQGTYPYTNHRNALMNYCRGTQFKYIYIYIYTGLECDTNCEECMGTSNFQCTQCKGGNFVCPQVISDNYGVCVTNCNL